MSMLIFFRSEKIIAFLAQRNPSKKVITACCVYLNITFVRDFPFEEEMYMI